MQGGSQIEIDKKKIMDQREATYRQKRSRMYACLVIVVLLILLVIPKIQLVYEQYKPKKEYLFLSGEGIIKEEVLKRIKTIKGVQGVSYVIEAPVKVSIESYTMEATLLGVDCNEVFKQDEIESGSYLRLFARRGIVEGFVDFEGVAMEKEHQKEVKGQLGEAVFSIEGVSESSEEDGLESNVIRQGKVSVVGGLEGNYLYTDYLKAKEMLIEMGKRPKRDKVIVIVENEKGKKELEELIEGSSSLVLAGYFYVCG